MKIPIGDPRWSRPVPAEAAEVYSMARALARLGVVVVRRGEGGWVSFREVEGE